MCAHHIVLKIQQGRKEQPRKNLASKRNLKTKEIKTCKGTKENRVSPYTPDNLRLEKVINKESRKKNEGKVARILSIFLQEHRIIINFEY